MVATDLAVGVGLTLLAWMGLLITVVRGRSAIERRMRERRVESPEAGDEEEFDEPT